ncbi:MAG: caspase family protein [Bacteroidales bacterium]|nr:caspase family protein [Bacteroidales bacterium]
MKKILTILLFLFCQKIFAQNIYVVSVGVDNYRYTNSLLLPGKDAKAVSQFFKTKTSSVVTITGRYATKAEIVRSLKAEFSKARENDMVVFFFSGHGYEGGFCLYDTQNGNQASKLSYEEVKDIFKKSSAKYKIIFADACHSGGLTGGNTNSDDANSAFSSSEVLLFLSSRANEYSQESPFMANGHFTAYLLSGLKGKADKNSDRKVTAKELFEYVSKNVIYKTNGNQHPVMWGKFDGNMVLNKF